MHGAVVEAVKALGVIRKRRRCAVPREHEDVAIRAGRRDLVLVIADRGKKRPRSHPGSINAEDPVVELAVASAAGPAGIAVRDVAGVQSEIESIRGHSTGELTLRRGAHATVAERDEADRPPPRQRRRRERIRRRRRGVDVTDEHVVGVPCGRVQPAQGRLVLVEVETEPGRGGGESPRLGGNRNRRRRPDAVSHIRRSTLTRRPHDHGGVICHLLKVRRPQERDRRPALRHDRVIVLDGARRDREVRRRAHHDLIDVDAVLPRLHANPLQTADAEPDD